MTDRPQLYEALTDRERQILGLLVEGLSNHEMAAQLYLTNNTIKWYNRQIYAKLGVNSRAQAILRAQQLALLEADAPPEQARVFNLPSPTTALIGRRQQIDELRQLMLESRLITLTGPGGSGKTRLALELAWLLAASFDAGAVFVDLAPVNDSKEVVPAIAQRINVFENTDEALIETIKRALKQRNMLLIADNFEQVIERAPVLNELLEAAPRLKILVTSREALRLTGEQEYPVPPLTLPVESHSPGCEIEEAEAVNFFVQRAARVRPGFTLNQNNAQTIAQICLRLDGLPLALELAAARCKLMSPETLLTRLEDRLDVLRGGARDLPARQQTLRSTLEWSYQLLDDSEKRLFARLAVFRGGRSFEAIEAVCSDDDDIVDTLAGLVDKSLLYQQERQDGELRFWMLETIQDYADECLGASGEEDSIRRRHAEYFVDLCERANPELRLANHFRWSELLSAEHDNLRAALDWAYDNDEITLCVRMVSALDLFWHAYGWHVEGLNWTQRLLDRIEETDRAYHAAFLICASKMIHYHNLDEAQGLCKVALEIARELDDKPRIALALIELAYYTLNHTEKAIALAEQGVALYRDLGEQPGIAHALNILGEIARYGGDDERAREAYEACLDVVKQTGETRRHCFSLENLAFIAQHQGDHRQAISYLQQALRISHKVNSPLDIGCNLIAMAGSLAALGQPQRAARLIGASDTIYAQLGAFIQPADQPETERAFTLIRTRLSEDEFEVLREAGQAMALEAAIADALIETDPD